MTDEKRVIKLCRKLLQRAGENSEKLSEYELIDQVMEECSNIPSDEDFILDANEIKDICLQEHEDFYGDK